jgi:membrane-bound lytic murein transglycosylase D
MQDTRLTHLLSPLFLYQKLFQAKTKTSNWIIGIGKKWSILAVIWGSLVAVQAQEMPRTMELMGLQLYLEPDARLILKSEIENLGVNRTYLQDILDKMALYMPLVEQVLAEEEIPQDFKYLLVQESKLNPDAISTSNAVGFWQFKLGTAREVGLQVNEQVDERRHIIASTRGAAISFGRNNLILKNWLSTLLAHRLGLSGASRTVPLDWANATELRINAQTDWYVLRFLAYRYVLDREYSIFKSRSQKALFSYRDAKGKTLKQVAVALDVPENILLPYNTWLQTPVIPTDKEYTVLVPTEIPLLSSLEAKALDSRPKDPVDYETGFPLLKRLNNESTGQNSAVYYEINGKRGVLAIVGDTPDRIAKRADLRLKKFLRYNDLDKIDRPNIVPGKVYYLEKKERKAKVVFHVVRGDESLWEIAQMYGIRLEDLMGKNRLATIQRLQRGRLVWLMETRPEKVPIEYVVAPKTNEKTPKETEKGTAKDELILENKPNADPSTVVTRPETPPAREGGLAPATEVPNSSTTTVVTRPEGSISEIPTTEQPLLHTVSRGDTYFSVAQKYGLSVSELRVLNGLSKNSPMRSGQVLVVSKKKSETTSSTPPITTVVTRPETSTTPTPAPEVVQPGSNTSVVTRSEGETPAAPAPASVPASEPSPTAPAGQVIYHTVKPGETVFRVSVIHKVAVEDVRRWNNLKNNQISVGQKLKIWK